MTISIITHSVILSSDGYDDLELDCSSFSWSATVSNGVQGSVVIAGLDDASDISDMIDNGATLTITKTKDGSDDTLLEDMDVDDLSIYKGPTNRSMQLDFSGSNATAGDDVEIDDLTAYESYQNGFWSFRLPEMFSGYAPGLIVSYNEIDRYIASVSVEWSGGGAGTVTLTEGEREGAETSSSCQYEIESGVQEEGEFVFDGSCVLFPWKKTGISLEKFYFSPDMLYYVYQGYEHQYTFTLSAESTVDIVYVPTGGEITTIDKSADPNAYYDISYGDEMLLISGEIDPWVNAGANIITRQTGPTWTFTGTLSAGTYTIRLNHYYWATIGYEYTLDLTVS